MKTKFFLLLLLPFFFGACSQDDSFEVQDQKEALNNLRATDVPILTFNWSTEDRWRSGTGYIKGFSLGLETPVLIDWGDGNITYSDAIDPSVTGYSFDHIYSHAGDYNVRVFGDPNTIRIIWADNTFRPRGEDYRVYPMNYIDFTLCVQIRKIYLRGMLGSMTTLDVSKNLYLEHLSCGYNSFISLDVSKNTELKYLYCERSNLTSLDLSRNTKLRSLYIEENNLTSLNLSNCPDLWELGCGYNQLNFLDLSNNLNLNQIFAENNPNLFYILLKTDQTIKYLYKDAHTQLLYR